MTYGIKTETSLSFDDAIERVKKALSQQGFGVLTEINVQGTLKTKLGVDTDKYIILGACNPGFAHQALQAEEDIGLLLPCNVIVYEHKGKTIVNAIKPSVAMGMVDNPKLADIAGDVEQRLTQVIQDIAK